MRKYTTADFREAQFARADDGLLAIRALPVENKPWLFVTKRGTTATRSDFSMSREDWVPVTHVPGRTTKPTIKASEVEEAAGAHYVDVVTRCIEYMDLATVVPEPTNAEKLEQIVMNADVDCLGGYETLAAYLDKAGVKAPETDDE